MKAITCLVIGALTAGCATCPNYSNPQQPYGFDNANRPGPIAPHILLTPTFEIEQQRLQQQRLNPTTPRRGPTYYQP